MCARTNPVMFWFDIYVAWPTWFSEETSLSWDKLVYPPLVRIYYSLPWKWSLTCLSLSRTWCVPWLWQMTPLSQFFKRMCVSSWFNKSEHTLDQRNDPPPLRKASAYTCHTLMNSLSRPPFTRHTTEDVWGMFNVRGHSSALLPYWKIIFISELNDHWATLWNPTRLSSDYYKTYRQTKEWTETDREATYLVCMYL